MTIAGCLSFGSKDGRNRGNESTSIVLKMKFVNGIPE
eukprot:jgi/Antlo1/245/1916